MLYAMPWRYYAGRTANDERALIAAWRKVPPVSHIVLSAKILKP